MVTEINEVNSTCNDINSTIFTYTYNNVGGLATVIGNPSNFNILKFPIKATASGPITNLTCTIYELPDDYDGTKESLFSKILVEKIITLDKEISDTSTFSILEINFDDVIENADEKYLLARMWFGGGGFKVTMGMNLMNYADIPYNPGWYYCTSSGNGTPSAASSNMPGNDKTTTEMLCISMVTYLKSIKGEGKEIIDISDTGKFFELVNNSLSNSTFGKDLFNTKIKGHELVFQTMNLTSNISSKSFDYHYAAVGGLATVLGNPKYISSLKFPVQPTSSGPIRSVICEIYKLPIDSTNKPFNSYDIIGNKTMVLETPIEDTTKFSIIEVIFDKTIENSDEDFLMLKLWFGGSSFKVNLGMMYTSMPDIPYNPGWYYCTSTSDGTPQKAVVEAGSDINSKTPLCIGCELYYLPNTSTIEYYIDSSPEGKFAKQVYAVIGKIEDDPESNEQLGKIPPSIYLPKQFDVVVGDTFQLFYESVVRSFEWDNEEICAISSVGANYPRYYEFTPNDSNVGKTYDLRLVDRNIDGEITCDVKTKIVVHPKLTNDTTPSVLNVLCFGDSLTASGTWAAEGLRRIYGTNTSAKGPISDGVTNTIVSYGSKSNTTNTFKMYHEGYGGWTWASFLAGSDGKSTTNGIIVTLENDHNYDLNTVQKSIWIDNNNLLWELEDFPSSNQIKFNRGEENNNTQNNITNPISMQCDNLGLLINPIAVGWEAANPFYNAATNTIDFINHANKYGCVDGPDIVTCLLTWNSTGSSLQFEKIPTAVAKHMSDAETLLKKIHEDFPNSKIIVMGIPGCSMTGGRGYNGGAQAGVADRFSGLFYAMEYNKALEELCTNAEFAEYCYYVDTKSQFDARYSMPYTYKPVNVRSTVTELFGTNGVHPNTEGYYQIGDAFYRALTKVIPIVKQIKENNN